jgi:hypothetical protein
VRQTHYRMKNEVLGSAHALRRVTVVCSEVHLTFVPKRVLYWFKPNTAVDVFASAKVRAANTSRIAYPLERASTLPDFIAGQTDGSHGDRSPTARNPQQSSITIRII